MSEAASPSGPHLGEIEWFDDLGVRVCLMCGDVQLVSRDEDERGQQCSGWLPVAQRRGHPRLDP